MAIFNKKNKKHDNHPPSNQAQLQKNREENFKKLSECIQRTHFFKTSKSGIEIEFWNYVFKTDANGCACVCDKDGNVVDLSKQQLNQIYSMIMHRQTVLNRKLHSKIMAERLRTLRYGM